MNPSFTRKRCPFILFFWVAVVLPADSALAQGPVPDAPQPSAEAASFGTVLSHSEAVQHSFWNKPNLALFGVAAALNMADFSVTRANLQSGGKELNPVVRLFGRSNAGLAVNFAGETAGVVGVSYFFHKIGHRKLERLTPAVNIGASAVAVAYGLIHR